MFPTFPLHLAAHPFLPTVFIFPNLELVTSPYLLLHVPCNIIHLSANEKYTMQCLHYVLIEVSLFNENNK